MSQSPKDDRITAAPASARPEIAPPIWLGSDVAARSWPARFWWLLALTHLAAVAAGLLLGSLLASGSKLPSADGQAPPGGPGHPLGAEPPGNRHVTLETFKAIQIGMTFDAVQVLFGDEGKSSWSGAAGEFGRSWTGRQDLAGDPSGPVPHIYVDVHANKVTSKRAVNLR